MIIISIEKNDMKLFKITQDRNNNYDTYSDAIVCAESEEDAKITSPNEYFKWHNNAWFFQYSDGTENESMDDSWTLPKYVKVEYIGEAKDGLEKGIVCSSFHAG